MKNSLYFYLFCLFAPPVWAFFLSLQQFAFTIVLLYLPRVLCTPLPISFCVVLGPLRINSNNSIYFTSYLRPVGSFHRLPHEVTT